MNITLLNIIKKGTEHPDYSIKVIFEETVEVLSAFIKKRCAREMKNWKYMHLLINSKKNKVNPKNGKGKITKVDA